MYIPAHFRQDDPELLANLIRTRAFATLITWNGASLAANHLPMLLSGDSRFLHGHLSRANTQWQDFAPTTPALAVFLGPDAYISPGWYPSKSEHGRVVPTWNFAAVHVTGSLRVIEDRDWLREHVTALTASQESQFTPPWQVSDAPPEYASGLLNAIVGLEIEIERMEGKWKVSQNRPEADRAGAAEGLRQMADLIDGI